MITTPAMQTLQTKRARNHCLSNTYCSAVAMLIITLASTAFLGCSNDEGGPVAPSTGTLQGTITDATTLTGVAGIRIIVFDANTNAPLGSPTSTDNQGNYSIVISTGTYYLKLYKQGYDEVPARGLSPIPLNVAAGKTTTYSVSMYRSAMTNGGFISGRVTASGAPVAGVFVVADDSINGFSSVTSADGSYFIFNLPPNIYGVKAWLAGYNSTDTTVNILANSQSANVNLVLTSGTAGSVNGKISFLATTNIEVDVTLTHPWTRETIPGLSTMTVNQTYTINNVPNGRYLARATYANDGKVVDPDWIIKNGEPFVTVTGGMATRDFSVTGAVTLLSPTNIGASTQMVDADTAQVFRWEQYSSANDYVIEVINAQGRVIWGGFSNNWTVKNIVIPTNQDSVRFNSDGNATERLMPGRIYRWKIYASKNDQREPTGWKLISTSEDQRGLIRIRTTP